MRGRHREKLWQQDIGIEREEKICDGKNKDQENIENGKRETMDKERITNVECVYWSNTIVFIGKI